MVAGIQAHRSSESLVALKGDAVLETMVVRIYDENDLAPEQPGLFHGEHDLT